MRALGIDFGLKRIGFAVSDPSGTLARPLRVVTSAGRAPALVVARVIADLAEDGDAIETIVIGLPKRLDGSAHELATAVEAFAALLRRRLGVEVVLQDERLSSHEADQRLSGRYRDWRDRKARLDAAAAAVVLQDYLDGRSARGAAGGPDHG